MAKRKIAEGDVFVRRHADGRYGAVHVLRLEGTSALVSTTPYLAESPPLATDPQLQMVVRKQSFSWKGQPAFVWVKAKPSAEFSFAFHVPLSIGESEVHCSVYGNHWDDHVGSEAYREWRWQHDREALQAEYEAERHAQAEASRLEALAQAPKRMIAEADFWALIGLLDWAHTGHDEAVTAPLVKALAASSKLQVRGFEERLAYNLYRLDTEAHASHIGSESYVDAESHFSADWFLYVRCAAVANGKTFYEAALADPQHMPKDLEFEALLGVSAAAWEAITGDDFEHETGCNRETFSNLAGWGT
jgi:Protein of unknown function (DUF4240)